MKYILKILACAYFIFIGAISGYGLKVCVAKVLYGTIDYLLKILITFGGIALFMMTLVCIALFVAAIFSIIDDIKEDVAKAKSEK